jgi:hypothetical protein
VSKALRITGHHGSMLFRHRLTTAAPISDRLLRLWVAPDEPTPTDMIGLTLCSFFHIDELSLDAWYFAPPRVHPPS